MMGSLRTPGTLTLAATPGRGARDTGNSNACLITACTVVKPDRTGCRTAATNATWMAVQSIARRL